MNKVGSPKSYDYDSLFEMILSDVKSGLTIVQSCSKNGVHSDKIYRNFTESQKRELRDCKLLLSKSFRQYVGIGYPELDSILRDNAYYE